MMKKKNRLFKSLMFFGIVFALIVSASPLLAAEKGKYGGTLICSAKETYTQFGIPWEVRGPADKAVQMAAQRLIQVTDIIGEFEPRLATSWETAADKSHFIFNLRKGVTFHDGTDFNAQAVKFNIDQVLKTERPIFNNVESVEVIDDYTVKVNLSSYNFVTINDFTLGTACIISPTAFETKDPKWLAINPVGTGPFKLMDYQARVHMKWEKNPDYWEKGYPYLDEVHQVLMPDAMTAEASFLNGDLHLMGSVDVITASQLIPQGFHPAPLELGGQMMIYMNTSDPNSIWSNQKVREALEYAIDKDEIAEKMGYGYLKASYECLWGIGAQADPGTTPRKYDPAKAKQLLKEAGYPNGVKAELVTMMKFYSDYFKAIQGSAKEGGFDLQLTRLQPGAWEELRFGVAPMNKGLHDRQRGGGVGILRAAQEDLSSQSIFYKGMTRPDGFDNALNKALNAQSGKESLMQLAKMETIAYNNAMFVPLWIIPDIELLRPEVKWNESERRDPFHVGASRAPRYEYLYLDK